MSLSSNTKSKRTDKINVYSSLVYVGVVSSIMFFAGLSSGVLVRKMDTYKIKNSLRITIGNNFENKKLIKTIRKII